MKTIIKGSLFAFLAFAFAACQPPASTNTNSSNTNSAPKAAAAATADSLMALDAKAWDAYSAKDGAFFNDFLADNFVGSENGKPMTKADVVKGISEGKCTVKSHTLSEPKMTMAGADVAVLTYRATVDGVCEGKKMESPLTVATVFVRSGDTWKGAYHNEVLNVEAKNAGGDKEAAKADEPNKTAAAEPKSPSTATNKAAETAKKEPAPPKEAANSTASTNSNSAAPAGGSDPLTEAVMAQEKKGWEAWMKHDAAAMESTSAKDLTFVDAMGKATFGQAEVIKMWTDSDCKVESVQVTDGKAAMIAKDTAILTFKGTAVGTCGGMKLEPLWGTTVAIKDGDVWRAVYIFEKPVEKM